MAESIEEIKRMVDELTEELRQYRIERGLPHEPPEDFVDEALSIILVERLFPFYPIAVKYAKLVAGGTYHSIDMSIFEKYESLAKLLAQSKADGVRSYVTGVGIILNEMRSINKSIDTGRTDDINLSSKLSLIEVAMLGFQMGKHDLYSDYQSDNPVAHRERLRQEVEMLKADPERLQAAEEAAWTHYESIKHLI
ncbi:hypothetical protein [Marinicrinis sediminis]|uniref:Uncharacterized protein n=1 Tax=Marinicrinis sediminis TaxID=1652465 RepID=A0ABW5RDI5_9BACL